jgi:hypothetical protein
MRSLVAGLLPLFALTLAACGDTIVNLPTQPSTAVTTTTGTTPAVVKSTIEFRVVGNPTSVRVRFSSPSEGLTQVVTTLPYSITFTTTADTLFLSLEATPIAYSVLTDYPFLSTQIVANGTLFREDTSNEFLLRTITVSGTWRR